MKKIIIMAAMLCLLAARAQTNADAYSSLNNFTNVWLGTSLTDPTRDTISGAFYKVNHNAIWFASREAAINSTLTNYMSTNTPGSSGGGTGGAILWNYSVAGLYPNGNTGSGGGWATTNTFIYPQ